MASDLSNKISDKLISSANKDTDKSVIAGKQAIYDAGIARNKGTLKIERNLLKEAHNLGARTLYKDGVNSVIDFKNNEDLRKSEIQKLISNKRNYGDREFKKRLNALNKNSAIINYDKQYVESLAHELGHLQNSRDGKLKKAFIPSDNKTYHNPEKVNGKTMGILDFLSDAKSRCGELVEESRASKRGLKLLKEAGASEEQLNVAKKNLKAAYDSYKYHNKADFKYLLSDKFRRL